MCFDGQAGLIGDRSGHKFLPMGQMAGAGHLSAHCISNSALGSYGPGHQKSSRTSGLDEEFVGTLRGRQPVQPTM